MRSLEESVHITPVVIVFVLLLSSSHFASLGLNLSHHFATTGAASHGWTTHVVARATHAHPPWWATVVVAISARASTTVATATSTSHHDALGLLLTIEDHQLLREVLILHAQLLADLNQPTETVNVVWVFSMNVLVDLESLIEEVHAAVARGNHKLPLDLTGLDLEGALEVHDGLLELVLFSMMHA